MVETNYHEKELLQSIADGNETSFTRFFRAVAPLVYADLAVVLKGDERCINAVLQETFIIVWLHRDKLALVKDLDAYLRSVALQECYNYLQDTSSVEPLPIPQYEEEVPPEIQHYKAYQSLIHDTILSLPEQRRLIYEMHRLKGMSPAQIAAAMQLSVDTVTYAINAVHQSVRQCLKDVAHSSVTSRHNQWVVEQTKLLEEYPPVIFPFDEHWMPMASKAMAIDRPIPADSTPLIRRLYSHRLNYLYAIIALVFLIVGPGLYLMVMRSERSASFRAISSSGQHKSRNTLPDGTEVWMNTGSAVRYPATYSVAGRVVEVEGEASFRANSSTGQPFHIRGYEVYADVTGTHFNIHAYTTPSHLVITALGSPVRVQTEGKDLSLRPGQQVDITQEGSLKVTPADTAAIASWKEELK
ncbi:sigma factor-like helix-turn-helix DNA-binding protein [Chitinophaga filiformis]|uniref:RNA polymerase sigma factor, sigma-70 family n=1 Tax=Chitinophaga filiformis TaxID=104663 RepID=A0A1G8B2R5_CHIFI|nr:sigma factor-like helix-turn-helix DNA-binding protein [Chitinophaga filiformis]SDH27468.1 RNA polymerase sigma factor, sigma-70 family [Chitinophaga filiformis]